MRRILCLLLAGMLLLGAVGCSEMQADSSDQVRIVATVFPQYDMARVIGGEYADVTLLLSAGQEMHNYEPSPMDVAAISRCDLFLRIGGEGEVWTDTVLSALDTSQMNVVTLMECIEEPLYEVHEHTASCNHGDIPEEECTEAHDHVHEEEHCTEAHEHEHETEMCTEDHAHEHGEEAAEHGHFDEHIWNSPINAIAMAQEICDALCAADPVHAEIFRNRAAEYIEALSVLDEQYRALSEECAGSVLIIGDKFPFRYLTAEYGFTYAAAFTGCSSETEPTIGSLSRILEEAEHGDADTVFYLEFSSSKICDRICDITGAQAAMLHPCHTISKEAMESGVTLLQLMEENYQTIKEALL